MSEMVGCPSCGKQGMVKGLMGGACHFCGDTARDRAQKESRQPTMTEQRESPSLTARIEALAKACQQRLASRQRALQQAQQDAEEMLRLEGAVNELNRWQAEIWEGKEDAGE